MTRGGFTLVETLVALALSALLMVACFRVIAAVGRGQATMARAAEADVLPGSPLSEAMATLRRDLTNARYVRAGDNVLTLTGYGGLDPTSLRPTHRPTRVTYRVRRAGGRAWLVREQSELDVPTNGGRTVAVVCSDVTVLAVSRVPAGNQPVSPLSARIPPQWAKGRGALDDGWDGPDVGLVRPRGFVYVPDRVRVALRRGDPASGAAPGVDGIIQCR